MEPMKAKNAVFCLAWNLCLNLKLNCKDFDRTKYTPHFIKTMEYRGTTKYCWYAQMALLFFWPIERGHKLVAA